MNGRRSPALLLILLLTACSKPGGEHARETAVDTTIRASKPASVETQPSLGSNVMAADPSAETTTTTTDTTNALDGSAPSGRTALLATPVPAGYTRTASLAYADDATIDPKASAVLVSATSASTAHETIDGDDVTLSPRMLVPLQDGAEAVVLTGKHGECHSCSGVVRILVVKRSGDALTIDPAASRTLQEGAWGEPAEVRVYQRDAAPPLMRLESSVPYQGCSQRVGGLYSLGLDGVGEVGPAYSVGQGCTPP